MSQNVESQMKVEIPPQHQDQQPGIEAEMSPAPIYFRDDYKASGKLAGQVALVTGADSGIGRAVAVLFAHEGADVAIAYLDEDQDAQKVKDYSSTKGAIVAFTRSLSKSLIGKGIRVNSVAPGPIWTPFIPSAMPAEEVATFGQDTPMKRVGQPFEVATCYVFLASDDSSYIAGQTLHPNGGDVVNA